MSFAAHSQYNKEFILRSVLKMGSSIPQKLGADCRLSSRVLLPRIMNGLFAESTTRIGDQSARIKMLADCIDGLEDEMKKIDGFKRELPYIMRLLHDAIVAMKEELVKCKRLNHEPVLEEFIPMKKSDSDDEKDDMSEDSKQMEAANSKDKMDWMRSVQLWNSSGHNDKKRKETDRTSTERSFKNRAMDMAFMPFKVAKEDKDELSGLSLGMRMPEIKNLIEGNNSNYNIGLKSSFSRQDSNPGHQQSLRKQRRCWSTELHQMFIDALNQLGGHEVATPKQIRELMQVDGLTNDEVKSHLQKYRLHLRKAQANGQTESSVQNKMQSHSPDGPLHRNALSDGDDDDDDDGDEDEKSETIQLSCRDL